MANKWSDLFGTVLGYFRIGFTGPRLKASGANLLIRNASDAADAEVTAAKVNVSGPDVVLDSDGNALTVSRNSTQSGALQVIFPPAKATDGQVLAQKSGTAAGVIEFELISASSTASSDKVDTTTLAFGSSSPLALFNTGAADIITKVQVIVDTAFDGTAPTLSIGVAGTTSKYMPATAIDLKTVGIYEWHPGELAAGAESLIATYAPDASAAGSARILVWFSTPS